MGGAALRVTVTLLCVACSEPLSGGSGGPSPHLAGAGGVDSAEDVGGKDSDYVEMPVTEEDAGGLPEAGLADWVFEDTVVHQVDIRIPPESLTALEASPYVFTPADFTYDGVEMDQIGVRLRGKIGSFRALTGKPKFKISFNQFTTDQRFYGLEELSLNNAVVDCSYLKEMLGYRVFAAAGVPSLRTAYAAVTVNSVPYGLYIVLETPDDRYLRDHYALPDGNFYDGKYVWYGGYSYTLLDFGLGVDDLYQLEEGVDVAHVDIAGVSNAVLTAAGTDQWGAASDAVIDWTELHRELAAEQWVGHNDGYALNTNNYRVYFDPTDGKAEILPWDLDYGFLNDTDWGMNWATPRGTVAAACWRDAACLAAQKAAMGELIPAVEAEDLPALLERYVALGNDLAVADPRRECAAADMPAWQDYMRSWVANRNDAMRTWWGL